MKRTIASLALIKSNWDTGKKDYIENFVPFIGEILSQEKFKEKPILRNEIEEIQKDFKEKMGLEIPYHPLKTILARAKRRKLLIRRDKKDYVNIDVVRNIKLEKKSKEKQAQIDNVLKEFIAYSNKKFALEITEEEAESIFFKHLKENDLDIIFAASEEAFSGKIKDKVFNNEYVFSKFVIECYLNKKEIYSIIESISIGNMLAAAILYNRDVFYNGSLKEVNYYFDTRFILRLIGSEGNYRKESYEIFLKNIKPSSNFYIFKHTYEEIKQLLENCKYFLSSDRYDPLKANMLLKYFVHQGASESDVQFLIQSLPEKLEKIGIEIIKKPDAMEKVEFQISEEDLEKEILNAYNWDKSKKRENNFDESLMKDIDSISSIYKLREGDRPTLLSELKHVFITTNSQLAYASKKFESLRGVGGFFFPAVLTDTFMGTVIWLNSPTKAVELNEKRIIANCYAALEPTKDLLSKFEVEIEKLKSKGDITPSQIYVLRASQVAEQALMSKTYGSPENFDDKTLIDVIEEVKENLIEEEREEHFKLMKEKEEEYQKFKNTQEEEIYKRDALINNKDKELIMAKEENKRLLKEKVEEKEKKEQIINIIFLVSKICFTIAMVIVIYKVLTSKNKYLITIGALISAIGLVTGSSIIGLFKRKERKIKEKLLTLF